MKFTSNSLAIQCSNLATSLSSGSFCLLAQCSSESLLTLLNKHTMLGYATLYVHMLHTYLSANRFKYHSDCALSPCVCFSCLSRSSSTCSVSSVTCLLLCCSSADFDRNSEYSESYSVCLAFKPTCRDITRTRGPYLFRTYTFLDKIHPLVEIKLSENSYI